MQEFLVEGVQQMSGAQEKNCTFVRGPEICVQIFIFWAQCVENKKYFLYR